ncbi:unnamed protein product [Gongylonema pulchrum]|uniref:DRBM domain-containing protein n=1 Tax=Gongylonema pulchrum TaxID=637853 RepID=A0A183ECK2_9BILA|nr:unnamed protein product [Gongylonema pulchrum]
MRKVTRHKITKNIDCDGLIHDFLTYYCYFNLFLLVCDMLNCFFFAQILVDLSTPEEEDSPECVKKVRAALRSSFGIDGFEVKLLELINSGDENISKLFVPQTLEYTIFSMDLDGDQQCILTLRGPNEIKNSFCGFGRTEKDAKNWAARNALTHLELFLRNIALFPAKDAQKEKPPASGSQQKPPTTNKPTPGRCLLTDL